MPRAARRLEAPAAAAVIMDAAAAELHLREALATTRAVAGVLARVQIEAGNVAAELTALRRVAHEAERWLAAADPADAGPLRAALTAWRGDRR